MKRGAKINLFELFDSNLEGFITGINFLEKAKELKADMQGVLKYESMVEYVEREMKNSIITEDIFQKLVA